MTCPTPNKRRYATREVAQRVSHRIMGVSDEPKAFTEYQCTCAWWHLTTSTRTTPADTTPSERATHINSLSDNAFAALVARDLKDQAEARDAAALRDPLNVWRWLRHLGRIAVDTEGELGECSKNAPQRSRIMARLEKVTARRREARDIKAATRCQERLDSEASESEPSAERDRRAEEAMERTNAIIAAHGIDKAEFRRRQYLAKNAAYQRLVDRHLEEFLGILDEEEQRAGVPHDFPAKPARR